MALISRITENLKQRAWWANALLAFCLYMTIVYLPFDLFFKPLAQDQEVCLGSCSQAGLQSLVALRIG